MPASTPISKLSPLRLLDEMPGGQLASGELGVLIAPAGVGKTSCLVQMALDYLIQQRRVAHVSLGHPVPRVAAWYDEGFKELIEAAALETATVHRPDSVMSLRHIVAFKKRQVPPGRIHKCLQSLVDESSFTPSVVIVDGFSLGENAAEVLPALKVMAQDLGARVWMSVMGKGGKLPQGQLPPPCDDASDVVDVALRIKPKASFSRLQALKDRETIFSTPPKLRLNSRTLLRELD